MRQHINTINHWLDASSFIAIARVIGTWGSSPRPVGSVMVIDSTGKIDGSVSGGCVEGEVVKHALQMMQEETLNPAVLEFGISDEQAWSSGLSCGGKLKVLVQVVKSGDGVWRKIQNSLQKGRQVTVKTDIITGDTELLEDNTDTETIIREENGREYFYHIILKKPTLLLVGIAHVTVDLVYFAKMFDFETIVIDPRGFFSENTSFKEHPDKIITDYPSEVLDAIPLDKSTYCAVLSHDPKIDDNALEILLRSDVAYIGALGSRRTHQKRIERLEKKGFPFNDLKKIKGPIGLDIGATGAREIAFSIMGEVLARKNKVI